MSDHSETTSRSRSGSWTRSRGETITRTGTGRTGVVEAGYAWTRRVSGRASRLVRAVAGWLRETVEPLGWFLLAVLVLAIPAAFALGWTEAAVVAIVAALLVLMSLVFLIGGTDIDMRLVLERDRVVAGTDAHAALHLTNTSHRLSLPCVVDVPVGDGLVEVRVPLLLGRAVHVEPLTIGARRRGVVQIGPMTIARGDPIGILRREVAWPQVEQLYIHPATVSVPRFSAGYIKDIDGNPSRQIVDADLAFHAVREYLPGDSHRHVHWKATARTGTLMVRQYEESRRSRLGVVLDLVRSNYADDEEFELAVSAATSLALQGVREGRDVLLAVSAEQPESTRGRVMSVRTLPTLSPVALLDAAATIEAHTNALTLEEAVGLTGQSHPDLSILYAVTGSLTPLARARRAAFAAPKGVLAVVTRCERGAQPGYRPFAEFSIMTVGALVDVRYLMARGAAA
ncbi:DUF58 domain-containing protein [Protaetiibacter intestinalis]|uniref:DUF58 domain-containing protein n=1 Tax=Protaetiibacter intestinalis TaxID=2419774 RepID=A0A387B7H6_9MICO|nr:DUF58 domain-containing protein [Protaetiibacter intestinalis]AYF97741.1 DUF58 domain-containing protein [Protaetiibacter intestinalis]